MGWYSPSALSKRYEVWDLASGVPTGLSAAGEREAQVEAGPWSISLSASSSSLISAHPLCNR